MRAASVVACCCLVGCVNFQPLSPPWQQHQAPVDEVAAAATMPTSVPTTATNAAAAREFGQSVQGRPLCQRTLGHGPRRVLWIGGIHGDEREGSVATMQLPEAFLAQPGAGEIVTLTIVEDLNPDGSAQHARGNANGVDLNRNFPAGNFSKGSRQFGREPLSQPETQALHRLVTQLQPHLVIVVHSWHDDHFINFDGPGEQLARLFAAQSGYAVRRSEEIAATPGSLGSWLGKDLRIPILTLEYHRGRSAHSAWAETRAAILAVVMAA